MRFLRRYSRGASGGGSLDVTPLIDIVFNLNIFFLLTSSYYLYSGIKINVPTGPGARSSMPDVDVTLTPDGRIYVERTAMPLGLLQRKLAELKRTKPDLSVLIRGDTDGRIGTLVDVYTACKYAGIENVQVQTQAVTAPPDAVPETPP